MIEGSLFAGGVYPRTVRFDEGGHGGRVHIQHVIRGGAGEREGNGILVYILPIPNRGQVASLHPVYGAQVACRPGDGDGEGPPAVVGIIDGRPAGRHGNGIGLVPDGAAVRGGRQGEDDRRLAVYVLGDGAHRGRVEDRDIALADHRDGLRGVSGKDRRVDLGAEPGRGVFREGVPGADHPVGLVRMRDPAAAVDPG